VTDEQRRPATRRRDCTTGVKPFGALGACRGNRSTERSGLRFATLFPGYRDRLRSSRCPRGYHRAKAAHV